VTSGYNYAQEFIDPLLKEECKLGDVQTKPVKECGLYLIWSGKKMVCSW